MPFRDALDLFKYWAKFPPVHILVRGFVGYEPPDDVDQEEKSSSAPPQTPTDMDHRSISGLPGYDIKGLPDWHREALERAMNKRKE